jgi:hypothetical protein
MKTKNYSTNRRGFLKGMAAGVGGYALGSLLIHPEEAMGQSIESNLEKIPMEVRWKTLSGASVNNSVSLSKCRYDKDGREKFNEDTKIRAQGAGARMKEFGNSFGFTGNDPKSMAVSMPVIITLFSGPQIKFEIEEATEEKARVKCVNCTLWNAMQAQKITDDLCSTGSQYMWEGFAKAMNSKMTSTLVKARPRGDSVCEWVIELKA